MFKAYKFRMYPKEGQRGFLTEQFGACRFVWNHFLALRNEQYAKTGKGMTYSEMSAILTEMKEDWKVRTDKGETDTDQFSSMRTLNHLTFYDHASAGIRTRVKSLGSFCATATLHSQSGRKFLRIFLFIVTVWFDQRSK